MRIQPRTRGHHYSIRINSTAIIPPFFVGFFEINHTEKRYDWWWFVPVLDHNCSQKCLLYYCEILNLYLLETIIILLLCCEYVFVYVTLDKRFSYKQRIPLYLSKTNKNHLYLMIIFHISTSQILVYIFHNFYFGYEVLYKYFPRISKPKKK